MCDTLCFTSSAVEASKQFAAIWKDDVGFEFVRPSLSANLHDVTFFRRELIDYWLQLNIDCFQESRDLFQQHRLQAWRRSLLGSAMMPEHHLLLPGV